MNKGLVFQKLKPKKVPMRKGVSMIKKCLFLLLPFLFKCSHVPPGVQVVEDFEVNRYLGTWYEIARLDHRFERGLEKISAKYVLEGGGKITVINKGFNPEKGEWKTAKGKAYLLDDPTQGRLKVSFFGPFYASYNIIALDQKDYSYAMVCGPNKDYFWVLAREPKLPKEILDSLLNQADKMGFQIKNLIYVDHN